MMRALTLTQPWAGLVASGIKLVENRSWPPPRAMIGQQFAIHAGKKLDRDTIEDLLDDGVTEHELWRMRGAAIAVARLDGYVAEGAANPTYKVERLAPDQRRWFFGPFGFLLSDVRALPTPIPCKGALGFWPLPMNVEHEVVEQLELAL